VRRSAGPGQRCEVVEAGLGPGRVQGGSGRVVVVVRVVAQHGEGGDEGEADQAGEQLEQVVVLVVALVHQHLEEGDVEEGAHRQALQHHHRHVLPARVQRRLLHRDA